MPRFEKLKLKQFSLAKDRETSENKYWKSFVVTAQETLHSSPNCVHFTAAAPDSYLVTASTKVSLYDCASDKVLRSYTRFQDDAFSGRFRKDGKLIVAGDKSGCVKVFDVQTKALLRQLNKHSAAVRTTVWAASGLHMLSGGDDKKVIRWDLGTHESIWTSKSHHTDYVRSIDAHPMESEIFISASYDHCAALWDSRTNSPVINFTDFDAPIEYCMFAPSGNLIFTASKNEVKVWDILSGGKLMHTFCSHQKNISCLASDSTGSKLLSCGLDGHVKVYSMEQMRLVNSMKYGSPLSSVALSPDSRKLVVGFVDGTLTARSQRKASKNKLDGSGEVDEADIRQRKLYKGAGAAVISSEDVTVEAERLERLKPYEVHLKKFNYQKSLDAALNTRNPVVVITVLEELARRSGLVIALSGRDEVALEPLLSFVSRYVSHPKYSRLIILVAERLIDLYGCVLGHSDAIDELFLKLQRQVKTEVSFQRNIMQVMGSLDNIINSCLLTHSSSIQHPMSMS